jgi:hypothetical protein
MPGDLQDPTQIFPFHNESRYEPGTNTFEPCTPIAGLNRLLQNLAGPIIGRQLGTRELLLVKTGLEDKGFLHRNWGDEAFRNEAEKQIKSIAMSQRMTGKWLILTNY